LWPRNFAQHPATTSLAPARKERSKESSESMLLQKATYALLQTVPCSFASDKNFADPSILILNGRLRGTDIHHNAEKKQA
jgi:hypothetical protein